MQNQITLGDILNEYGEGYISRNRISGQEKGLLHLLPGPAGVVRFSRITAFVAFFKMTSQRSSPACRQQVQKPFLLP